MNEMLLFTLPKDEWITIADTTLTEDVASLEFTTDISGNPFECKKIFVWVEIPGGMLTEKTNILFPNSTYGDKISCVLWQLSNNSYGFQIESEIEPYDKMIKHAVNAFSYVQTQPRFSLLQNRGDSRTFTKYGVYLTSSTIPSGAKIKVWGLKA